MPAVIQIPSGTRFGRYVALFRDTTRQKSSWICQCACGTVRSVDSWELRSGRIQSCGCQARERFIARSTKHGESHRTREYRAWKQMRKRCLSKTATQYDYYGGRGITICVEWDDYSQFLLDMGRCPENFTLDRIDVNGNYNAQNCRWASRKTQAENRRPRRWHRRPPAASL